MIDAYKRTYPAITDAQACRALHDQGAHLKVLEILGVGGREDFGGSWYDPVGNIWHVYVVSDELDRYLKGLAEELDFTVETERTPYGYPELERLAAEINRQRDPSEYRVYFAGADGSVDRVKVLVVDPARVEEIRSRFAHDPRVRVVEGKPIENTVD